MFVVSDGVGTWFFESREKACDAYQVCCIDDEYNCSIVEVINKTPHPVTLVNGDKKVTIQPDSIPARCESESVSVDYGIGIPCFKTEFGEVNGLPEEKEGIIYIVSSITAQALKGKRNDCFIVAETVRDDQGRIVGAKCLAKI